MGRTQKVINWDLVERKIEAGCSAKEICGGLVHIDTFYTRFREEYGMNFADFAGSARETGLGNIRFRQYQKAMEGNGEMLKLLGREWLEQGKDELEKPTNDLFNDVKHENMLLRAELAESRSSGNDRDYSRKPRTHKAVEKGRPDRDSDKPKTGQKLCRSGKKV